ncbi:MAG: YbdD/YjiX family protein [Gemmatimonadetes bacterium]|nr:YbdD/YjiX family protein [Gemmatimonadota bacterium]
MPQATREAGRVTAREEGSVGSQSQDSTLPSSRAFALPAVRRLARVVRQVFGMPDYDRYVEHRRARHPGEPVLSCADYFVQQIERRYSGGPNRCC